MLEQIPDGLQPECQHRVGGLSGGRLQRML
jgi:hypothetical protein